MAFRLRYYCWVDFLAPGQGMMMDQGLQGPDGGSAGAQTLKFLNTPGGQVSLTFTGTDITNLTNAMAADMVTQFTAALTRIQGFSSGGT